MTIKAEPHQVSCSDREARVEGALLRDVAHLVIASSRWSAVDQDFARRKRDQPEKYLQEGRLADAVWSEHSQELTRLNG